MIRRASGLAVMEAEIKRGNPFRNLEVMLNAFPLYPP